MWEDCKIFGHLRRWFLRGCLEVFFPLKDSTTLNIFLSWAALSWLGNDLGNCPASVSRSNSPSQIHGIIFGQSNVSHCRLRRVQTGPPNGSHFYLFLKIQRLLKEQLDKVEDWRSLIFLFQWNETPVLFFLPLSLKSRSQLGGCSCVKAVGMPLLITLITRTKEDKIKSSTIEAVEESLPRCQWTVKYKNCIPIHFYRRETRNYITYSWRVCP